MLLAGIEEEVELRDDPSDLKVSIGGKALALPSPKLGSLSSSLKALWGRKDKRKNQEECKLFLLTWFPHPHSLEWKVTDKNDQKEPPDSQPSPRLNQDTLQLGRGTDLT